MALSGAPFLTATLSLHAVHCVCCLGTDIQDLCRLGWTQKCWDPSSANPLARTACQSACTRARNLRELTAIVPWQTRCRKKFCCKGSLAWHMIFHDIPLAFASVMRDKNHDAAATLSSWLVRKSSPKALNSLSALRQPPRTFEIR